MTSGTWVKDGQVDLVVYLPHLGYTAKVGPYERKTWDGGDRPSSPRVPPDGLKFVYEPNGDTAWTFSRSGKVVPRLTRTDGWVKPFVLQRARKSADSYKAKPRKSRERGLGNRDPVTRRVNAMRRKAGLPASAGAAPLRHVWTFNAQGVAKPIPYPSFPRLAPNSPRGVKKPKPPEPHPYTMETFRVSENPGIATLGRNVGGPLEMNYTCTWLAGNPSVTSPWNNNDDIALLGKLRERCAGSDFNLGVAAAESNQGLSMIFNAASRIAKGLSEIRRGNIAGAWTALVDSGRIRGKPSSKKTVAQNWLELQYGWLPLLKDAEAGAEFLAHMHSSGSVQRVTARRQRPLTITGIGPGYWVGLSGYHSRRIVAYITETDVVGLSGLQDPTSVAWELVPYSFVADWFIPIGNYLSARALSQSVKGTFVTSDYQTWQCSGRKGSIDSTGWETSYTDVYSPRRAASLVRTVSTELSVPLPVPKTLGEIASWRHTANAVALVIVAGSRGRGF